MNILRISVLLSLWGLVICSASAIGAPTERLPSASEAPIAASNTENHLIFENIYGNMPPQSEEQPLSDLKAWRAAVKDKMGMNLYTHLHVGLDRVKSKSSLDQRSEIVALESHLAPRSGNAPSAKGYGIAFKFKLD